MCQQLLRFMIVSSLLFRVCADWLVSDEVRADDDSKPAEKRMLVPLPKVMPAPKSNRTTPEKVALGKQLFFDPRLSGDNSMSCATCHQPDKAFGDGLALSPGFGGKKLTRHTQGLWNVGLFSSFFWDGRAKTLEEQALGPIENPNEMNQNLDDLVIELNQVEGYRKQFQSVFGSDVTKEGIAKSIAAFERTLVTPDSPFDRYLRGDEDAISSEAKRGLELFKGSAGCIKCHNGPLLSDGKYYRLGVSFKDRGRSLVSGDKDDDYAFRTPSLRDITETGPYMHDGSIRTLTEVVEFYYRSVPSKDPEGRPLDAAALLDQSFSEIDAVVAFLRTLSGKQPRVKVPALP